MSQGAVCTIVEAEINMAIGMINAMKPDADMATRNLQNALLGVVVIGYGAIIPLILEVEQAIMNTCTFQCMADKWEQSDTRRLVCKLLKECRPAKDFIFTKTGQLLSNYPPFVREASRRGISSSQLVTEAMLEGSDLMEKYICDMSLEDYLNLVTDWILGFVAEKVAELRDYIQDKARLEMLDRIIRRTMEDAWEYLRPIKNSLLQIQAFINECPLLCDLSEGLAKKMVDDYEDFKESTEALMEELECWNNAFSEQNSSNGWIYMHDEYEKCLAKREERTYDDCNMPFRWLCKLDSWVNGKVNALVEWSEAKGGDRLADCVGAIGGEEEVDERRTKGLGSWLFSDEDFDGMDSVGAERVTNALDRLGNSPSVSGLIGNAPSVAMYCDGVKPPPFPQPAPVAVSDEKPVPEAGLPKAVKATEAPKSAKGNNKSAKKSKKAGEPRKPKKGIRKTKRKGRK